MGWGTNHQAEKLGIEEKTASPFPSANFISEQFRGIHLPDDPERWGTLVHLNYDPAIPSV
jgi:hypothetical protein